MEGAGLAVVVFFQHLDDLDISSVGAGPAVGPPSARLPGHARGARAAHGGLR